MFINFFSLVGTGDFLVQTSELIKKNFETQMWIDGKQMLLNHQMQETLGNVLFGFSKSLKGQQNATEIIEVKTKHLHQTINVDAQAYT
jgi:hypothetical protein